MCALERETGLEPATLCLGSTLVGWTDLIAGQEVEQKWGDFGPFSPLQIRRVGRASWLRFTLSWKAVASLPMQ